MLHNARELRAFLENEDNYPLFCKPVEGLQSLGTISLKNYSARDGMLETFDGRWMTVDRFAAEITAHYGHGYLFQRHLTPHPEVQKICGARLATLRIVTMATESGPKIFRACWKIPAGPNAADNYWRSQNLLASIDPATWCVRQVMAGTGLSLRFHEHHPDTREVLLGLSVPGGKEAANTALEAARLMRDMPLIGWDIAVLESGPVIIEMNEKPDFFLNQLADGRGILDEEFSQFLRVQKRKAAERVVAIKREARQL